MATTANALLKFNQRRARRMPEADALARLALLGFEKGEVIRRTVHRAGSRGLSGPGTSETVVTEYHRHGRRPDGSPRYDRARLTVTFSI